LAISFSEEASGEIITRSIELPEDNSDGSLRPKMLSEYIGQEKAKENLRIFIQAAKMRGEALDHVLLHGLRDWVRPLWRRSSPMRWA